MLSLHYYVYTRAQANTNTKKIWVPPKAKPSLPFGLGPAPEPVKPEGSYQSRSIYISIIISHTNLIFLNIT
jgi:hypothetical protein